MGQPVLLLQASRKVIQSTGNAATVAKSASGSEFVQKLLKLANAGSRVFNLASWLFSACSRIDTRTFYPSFGATPALRKVEIALRYMSCCTSITLVLRTLILRRRHLAQAFVAREFVGMLTIKVLSSQSNKFSTGTPLTAAFRA
jgi:hypothetical protein